MLSEYQIIRGCKNKRKRAQKALYTKYAGIMRGVCLRYANSLAEAEDIMQEGFIKVFIHIDQYQAKGSFEGWIKRIMINTAITYRKKAKKHQYHFDIDEIQESTIKETDEGIEINEHTDKKTAILNTDFSQEEIMNIINQLPDGYKMVFNLYAIENFKHKEIAELLNIDISTSKSQLARARKLIQKKMMQIIQQKNKQKNSSYGNF